MTASLGSIPLWRYGVRRPLYGHLHRISSMRYRGFSSYLVTPQELDEALKKNAPTAISTAPKVIPVCAAWFMPNDPEKRTGLQVFLQKRIPTARFFDIDEIKDHESEWPHMLPTCDAFADAMSKMGVRREDEVVVYDTEELGLFSAPRVAWTMRVFGHPKVHILNNFRLWVKEGYPVETGPPEVPNITKYPVPAYNTDMVVKFAEMKTIGYDYGKEGSEEIQILDARSKGRWEGTEPEPRPGIKSGHMPGSTSLPFQELLDPETKALLPPEELRKLFESKQLDPKTPFITTCGTGVTAAVIEAALKHADFGSEQDRRLYDGSWTEWASRITPTSGLIQTKKSSSEKP
ncbi:putative 3-mercaptopyruvate sulfurtransferase [Fonsecaea pedrosoi]|nr:putative 3-mercaptopyruvate sulfurtransferase [Fonsecaea pedrosoi]